MKPFIKPAIGVAAQLELLKARGLNVHDEQRASCFLQAVSFFRLTPYMRPFQDGQDPNHRFIPESGFRDLARLYDFDRRLRLLVMDAIERVEVAVRAVISNRMGPLHGAHWYMDPQLFKRDYRHTELLAAIRKKQEDALRAYSRECARINEAAWTEIRKQQVKQQKARENYARYYPLVYDHPQLMPGWAALEELTLGELSHLFSGLARDADQKAIAGQLSLPAPLLRSWLHALTVIRNICAHHARLWNREPGIRAEQPKSGAIPWPQHGMEPNAQHRVYTVLCLLNVLMQQVSPHTSWNVRLTALLDEFPEIALKAMGMHPDWRRDPFWQPPRTGEKA